MRDKGLHSMRKSQKAPLILNFGRVSGTGKKLRESPLNREKNKNAFGSPEGVFAGPKAMIFNATDRLGANPNPIIF